MAEKQSAANAPGLNEPVCLCGVAMTLRRIEPHPTVQHADVRTFQCQECGHTLTQTFGDD